MHCVPVTVVIPNYNSGALLGPCIESVNAGVWPEEIVIVDDASTDGSLAVAEGLAKTFANVRVVRGPVNEGALGARWRGIQEARCDWIACIDADDTVEKGGLADAYRRATGSGADLCVWQLVSIQDDRAWPAIELNPDDFPMTGREAARRTLGAWRMHPLGVGRKRLHEQAYEDFGNSVASFNADELLTRCLFVRAGAVCLSPHRYLYLHHAASTSVALHPKRLGALDAHRWLVQFCIREGFDRGDLVRVAEAAVGSAWFFHRNRTALGKAAVADRIAHLLASLRRELKLRDWARARPGHLAAFLYLHAFYPFLPADERTGSI